MFADKVKERGSCKTAKCTEEDLDALAKPFHDHKAQHQISKASRKVALGQLRANGEKILQVIYKAIIQARSSQKQ